MESLVRSAPLPVVALVIVLAGCGATASVDGTDAGGGGADAAGADAGGGGADGGGGDGGADGAAPAASLDVTLAVDALFQNCMPSVPPDPISLTATVTVKNLGAAPAGPLTFSTGRFLGATSAVLAAFDVEATGASPVIAPGATAAIPIAKKVGSVSPANGCSTLACSSEPVVEIAYAGASVAAGATAQAAATVGCAY